MIKITTHFFVTFGVGVGFVGIGVGFGVGVGVAVGIGIGVGVAVGVAVVNLAGFATSATVTPITAATDQSGEGPFVISANTDTTPSIFTSGAHGFQTGQTVTTSATNSTPVIDGTFEVTVLTTTTFYVSLNGVPQGATVAGSAGAVIPTYTVVTAAGHGIVDGNIVTIANESTATPALNGDHIANVLSNDDFEIPIVTTVAGTDGDVATEFGTDTAPRHVTYYCAPCLDIVDISVADPGVITTASPHNLVTGDRIYVTGTLSTPALNGGRVVTVLSSTTFNVGIEVTVTGTVGSICIEKYSVKDLYIDSYDEFGDPTYLGNNLVNQRYNVAESHFEYILIEDSAVSSTSVKVHMIGYSDNVSKTNYSFLNPVETPFDWSAAADQVVAISSSTEDAAADVGALTLSVTGLTAGFVEVADETITMTGTTITAGAGSDFIRVNTVKVATVGANKDSGLSNSGTITVTRDAAGDHIATIPIGQGAAPMGIYTTPLGKSWCLSSINIYTEQKREFEVRVMVRENATASGPYMIHQAFTMGTQALIAGTNTEIDIPAQSDVWVTAIQKSGQVNGEVAVHLIGKLVTD